MPDSNVTIASTTDTQEQVNAAAGLVEDVREAAEQEEGAETEAEPQAAPGSEEEEHEAEQKHQSKRSQKIKRLAGKLTEAERERDEWRQKFEELQRGRSNEDQPKPETPRVDPYAYPVPKPKAVDYVNPQDFVEALTEWKVDEREYKAALKAQAEEQQAAQNEMRDSYGAQLAEAKAEYPDYEQVVGRSDLKIWPEVETALRTHEHGAELAYFLAKNPEITEKLAQMAPPRAVAELGAIASSFRNSAAPAPKPRIQPIKPVGGGTAKTVVDEPDKLPYREWVKWGKAQGFRHFNR